MDKCLSHGVEVAKHEIAVEFWEFHAISHVLFSELSPNPCGCGELENMNFV